MCGLTEKRINENGRISLNKFNAYKCLANTSSIEFENFDINRCIVVPDLNQLYMIPLITLTKTSISHARK